MNTSDEHLRYLPGPMAASMVAAGSAIIDNSNGRVKSIRLVPQPLQRIGPPSDGWLTPRFAVREKLDGGGVVWRHHPRCRDYE